MCFKHGFSSSDRTTLSRGRGHRHVRELNTLHSRPSPTASVSNSTEVDDSGRPITFAAAIPVGAWHPFLPRALESLATQGVPLQIALLDASGDPCVRQLADESGVAFAYRRHGPDQGQADAIAEGWRETSGDVLLWLNADDRLRPNALATASKAFAGDRHLAVFYGHSDFVDETGAVVGSHDQVAPIGPLLYRSNIISQPSCFVRRAWVNRVGGMDPQLQYTMDWDLWARLYAAGAPFECTEEVLSEVFMGAGTKTAEVNISRLREIASLVARHRGWWSAAKTTLSVAVHTYIRQWEGQRR